MLADHLDAIDERSAQWRFRQTASQMCRAGYAISGDLSAGMLSRTTEDGTTVVLASGAVEALPLGAASRAGFAVAVKAQLGLVCQSCAAQFEMQVDSRSTIYVAKDVAELDAWEEESFESIEASEKTSALELVEDELLLAIPYVPRCDRCSAEDSPKVHEFN